MSRGFCNLGSQLWAAASLTSWRALVTLIHPISSGVMTQTNTENNLNPSQSGAHTEEGEYKRFPEFILMGQINLHKSQECAASLARHIDKQWDFFRINRNGIISSTQLEINRAPERYGATHVQLSPKTPYVAPTKKKQLLHAVRAVVEEKYTHSSSTVVSLVFSLLSVLCSLPWKHSMQSTHNLDREND